MLLVAFLTALINPNEEVGGLQPSSPVVALTAIKWSRAPAQALMPLAFGAHAGSMLTLTGTPINVLVADAAEEAGAGRFLAFSSSPWSAFRFWWARSPSHCCSASACCPPGRQAIPPDLGRHARTLREQYLADGEAAAGDGGDGDGDELINRAVGTVELVVPPRSALVGSRCTPG